MHYVEASNKYMYDYSETKEISYMRYLDFNSQYRWALSETLNYGGFEYVEDVSLYFDIYFNYFEKNQFGQFGMW